MGIYTYMQPIPHGLRVGRWIGKAQTKSLWVSFFGSMIQKRPGGFWFELLRLGVRFAHTWDWLCRSMCIYHSLIITLHTLSLSLSLSLYFSISLSLYLSISLSLYLSISLCLFRLCVRLLVHPWLFCACVLCTTMFQIPPDFADHFYLVTTAWGWAHAHAHA